MNEDNWKHRSTNMLCATCMYFVEKIKTPPMPVMPGPMSCDNPRGGIAVDTEITITQPILGRCRRHAPTMKGWPAIFSVDWCGDHKIDENKI